MNECQSQVFLLDDVYVLFSFLFLFYLFVFLVITHT